MSAKEHYATHLANFYAWMVGDFESKQREFQHFLTTNSITPSSTKKAIDLGAGHGIQSIALATLGFDVTAVDFNQQLLDELKANATTLPVHILQEDITRVKHVAGNVTPELIVCCGDTLVHLDTKTEIENLLTDCAHLLQFGGKLLLSFRDYSTELTGDARFIPVKADDTRILTCVLEYTKDTVRVTDLLQEKTATGWVQKVSSYNKVRISPSEIIRILQSLGMTIQLNQVINRMTTILATKN